MSYVVSIIKQKKFVKNNLKKNAEIQIISNLPFNEYGRNEAERVAKLFNGELYENIPLIKEVIVQVKEKIAKEDLRFSNHILLSALKKSNVFSRIFYNFYIFCG